MLISLERRTLLRDEESATFCAGNAVFGVIFRLPTCDGAASCMCALIFQDLHENGQPPSWACPASLCMLILLLAAPSTWLNHGGRPVMPLFLDFLKHPCLLVGCTMVLMITIWSKAGQASARSVDCAFRMRPH
eukprot:TRINITY_DN34411_c0_g1_i4.p1 TRINITY_DN34411_c0_g1~~TRINITY_DN34411_c0_g1_i4.p1  ORF type:complete len:133 (-),score=3.58 TRINITY_DN34411_c0_g1_i4:56-454(-)